MRAITQNKQSRSFCLSSVLAVALSTLPLGALAQSASQPDDHDFVDLRQTKGSVAESSGAFQTSVAIKVPSFPGLAPSLGLSYSSGGGNSWVGVGWGLGGLSIIERAGPGKGAPTYTLTDIYLLDGEELVKCPTSGATSPSCLNPDGSANSTYYFTKHESYRRIRLSTNGTASNYTDDFWEITDKSGVKTKYTAVYNTGSSPAYTWRWGIATVTDRTASGNATTYTWDVTKGRPSSISYGGYSIVFSWEQNRPDPYKIATGLGFLSVTERLVTIEVKAGSNKIRGYKLAYNLVDTTTYANGRFRSELASVTQYGKDYTYVAPNITGSTTPSLPAVTMTYQPSTRGLTSATTWSSAGDSDTGSPTFVGDFDGDGKSDIMDVKGADWRVRMANAAGTGFTLFQSAKDWGWHQQSGDFDGDGKTDLIDYEPADNKWHLKHSNGSALGETLIPAGSGFNKDHLDFGTLFTADVNADGTTDLLYHYTQGVTSEPDSGWYVCLGLPASPYMAGCANWGPAFVKGESDTQVIGDFDGDGMSDILFHKPDGWKVFRSSGIAFEPAVIFSTAGAGSGRIMGGDFNGDGKSDMMRYGSTGWEVFLSNGKTFAAADTWSTHGACSNRQGGDFNGDGLTDFICKDTISAADLFVICYSLGDSFNCFNTTGSEVGDLHRVTGDFDGDGATDMAFYRNTQTDWRVRLSTAKPQLLTMVSNGIGGTTTVTYASSSDTNVVTSNVHNPPLRKVVKQVAESDGRNPAATTSYLYSGGYYDDAEREYVGFRKVTKNLPCVGGDCPHTEQYFVNGTDGTLPISDPTYPACSGHSDYIDTFDSANKLRKRSNAVYTGAGYTLDINGNVITPSTCLETGRWEIQYDGSGVLTCTTASHASCRSTYTGSTFDAFGNATMVTSYGEHYDSTNTTFGSDEKTSYTLYAQNPSAFIVGTAKLARVFAGIGTTGTLLSEALTYYDGANDYNTAPTAGLVTKTLGWVSSLGTNDPVSNPTAYVSGRREYDTLGQVTALYDSVGNKGSSLYDSFGHVTKVTNPLNQSVNTYYDAIGLLTRSTDANGKSNDTLYDALGRITKASAPGGAYALTSYNSLGTAGSQYVQVSNGPPPAGITGDLWAKSYFDGQGRVYKSIGRGPNATVGDIATEALYDGRGRLTQSCAAYYTAGTPTKYWTSTFFDSLDRVTKTTAPNGVNSTTSYGLWSSTITDPAGHVKVENLNAYGQVTSLVEKSSAGATAQTMTTEYDLRGNPTAVKYLGSGSTTLYQTTTILNSLGQKLSMTDPDLGTWSYLYDSAGRITWQNDGRAEVKTMAYDAVGRITAEASSSRTVAWTYDAGPNGIGRLSTVSYPAPTTGTDSISSEYDDAGRVTKRTQVIDGVAFTDVNGYDASGRMTKVTYPDGEVLGGFNYDASGRLTYLANVGSGALVSNLAYDASGRATFIKYGNGTETTQAFDTVGRLTRIKAYNTATPSNVYLDLSYGFNTEGLIASLTGGVAAQAAGESWTYEYDWQHQLTKATTNGTDVQTLAYGTNRDGNIATNSRAQTGATYTYGTSRPHAVSAVGANAYSYDGNGNMVGWAGRTVTFNAENKPASISGTTTTNFSYDGIGARVKKVFGTAATLYRGDDYEIDLGSGQVTKYISAGGMRVARRVGTTTTWLHSDAQGSLRAATNSSGVEQGRKKYRPFGESYSSTLPDSIGFSGHRQDETGLIFMQARYYDPQLGRFISADTQTPTGIIGLNRYAYCHNNPVSMTDPDGHDDGPFDEGALFPWEASANRQANAILKKYPFLRQTPFGDTPQMVIRFNDLVEQAKGIHLDRLLRLASIGRTNSRIEIRFPGTGCQDDDPRGMPTVANRTGFHVEHGPIQDPRAPVFATNEASLAGLALSDPSFLFQSAIRIQGTIAQGHSGGTFDVQAAQALSLALDAPGAKEIHVYGGPDQRALAERDGRDQNESYVPDLRMYVHSNPTDPIPGWSTKDPFDVTAARAISILHIKDDLEGPFVHDHDYASRPQPSFNRAVGGRTNGVGSALAKSTATHYVVFDSIGCFVRGTLVTMADGSKKPIDQLVVGDRVLAFDEKTGQLKGSEVTHLFVHPNWADKAETVLVNGQVRATLNHPFYINGKWVEAGELKMGDTLYRLTGGSQSLSTVPTGVTTLERLPGVDTVYNIEVDTYHTYFAGGILVHNKQ